MGVLESSLFASFGLTPLTEEVIVHTSTHTQHAPRSMPCSSGCICGGDVGMRVYDLLPENKKELASHFSIINCYWYVPLLFSSLLFIIQFFYIFLY